MILLLWASLAWGQPQFTQLEEGDVAPFAGRLLNDEAISKILVDQQLASDECQIAVDYELDIAMAQWSYQMSIQELTLEGKLQRSEVLVESQKEQIVYLQQQAPHRLKRCSSYQYSLLLRKKRQKKDQHEYLCLNYLKYGYCALHLYLTIT